jgi:hypothetical protein
MAIAVCNYQFPCHPSEMFQNSPYLEDSAKLLRVHIIGVIAELSQAYSQKFINKKLYVDIDENNNIIGLDMSRLFNINCNMCLGKRIKISKLKAENWITMSYK